MTVAASTKHPDYSARLPDWELLEDVYAGERQVKNETAKYLPPTSSMVVNGYGTTKTVGQAQYDAYIKRASFPDFLPDSVDTCLGLLWAKPPSIKVPAKLEPMLERMTVDGENILQLWRRVNEQQLITGRVGLLLDLPQRFQPGAPQLPYVATYSARSIINWDNGERGDPTQQTLNLVVLDETEYVRVNGFDWELHAKFRVLYLGDFDKNELAGPYSQRLYNDHLDDTAEFKTFNPSLQGKALQEIPFVFINSKDLLPQPDKPPLLSLARLCMTIYRGEADYRQNLFMQGQDTLVVIGAPEDQSDTATQVGANARLDLPIGADAKYVGVDGSGLMEQRLALENDKRLAASKSGQLVDTTSRQRESGEALNIRVNAQTATLSDIATACAGGIERVLKMAARWVGANEEEVEVTPNLEFINTALTTRSLVELVTAKGLGAPISQATIHEIMVDRKITQKTLEEEIALIKSEPKLVEDPPPTGNQSGTQGGSGRGSSGA